MKKSTKIVGSVLSGLALLGAGIMGGFALDNPQTLEPLVHTEYVDKIVYQDVVVEVEKEVRVEVDNGDMDFVLCRLEDKDVINDCDEIVEELKAEDFALTLALKALNDEDKVFDMLEDEDLISDEDDAEVIKLYDDFSQVEILNSDFDDNEYEFKIKMKVEDLDEEVKSRVWFTVSVEDGEAEITSVEKA